MEIKKIVDYINRGFIASDYLREPDIYYYMDLVIDDINERLQAKFPTFTEWKEFVEKWNAQFSSNPESSGSSSTGDSLVESDPSRVEEMVRPVHGTTGNTGINNIRPMLPFNPNLIRDNTKYDAFPDKYLRTVVALGTAVKYYTMDEEGEQIALEYQRKYEDALFKMTRDYISQVPWYFQDNQGGYIDFTYVEECGPRNLHPRGVVMRGQNNKVL